MDNPEQLNVKPQADVIFSLAPNFERKSIVINDEDGKRFGVYWNAGKIEVDGDMFAEPAAYKFFELVGKHFSDQTHTITGYRDMLRECAKQFKKYQHEHIRKAAGFKTLARHDSDNLKKAEDSIEKANTNERMVGMISILLGEDL